MQKRLLIFGNNYWLIALLLLMLITACKKTDQKKIIGRWQSDQDWFEYFEDSTYNSGKAFITMVKGFKYSILENKKELNMYTDSENQTYYLNYEFIGEDTLAVVNKLSSNKSKVLFCRVKKEQ